MLQVVIPIAGKAARFQEEGYTFPKPLVEVDGKPMIELVHNNLCLPEDSKTIFICRKEHMSRFYLSDVLRFIEPGAENVVLEHDTGGALCSVLLAIDHLDPDAELLIANGDQIIDCPHMDAFFARCREEGTDGCIMTFNSTHPRWSFARTDENGVVNAVAEKRPISRQATTGHYYFRRTRDFLEGAESLMLKGLRTSGQFFVCPVYNELVLAGKTVRTLHLPDGTMHSLGTPEDVELYVRRNLR